MSMITESAVPQRDLAIIIPAYNSVGTIGDTLRSIQAQGSALDRVRQVIVVDDASSDDTATVAFEVWKSPVPLVIKRNATNCGERVTVNRAADGLGPGIDWFFILHADDVAKPHWLAVMVRAIDAAANVVGALTASWDELFPDGSIKRGDDFPEEKKSSIHGTAVNIHYTLQMACWFKVSSCAIRTRAFRALKGFAPDMPQLGDREFALRMLQQGWTIDYIPVSLSLYRIHKESVSYRSLQEHRDIEEGLRILGVYRSYLSRLERLARHLVFLKYLFRRMVSSVLHRNWPRFCRACTLSLRVLTAAARSTAA